MPDCMMPFPEDWHDFLKDYSFDDSQEVYTNGSRLIPVFRVEQLIEHLLKAQEPITGETSDGYHTFNELYHHRAVLFSVIVANYPERAWKSKKHHDGTMYDNMFIVGIDTPDGQATYHYDIDPYWDMFKCRVLDNAPEWDGHTPAQAIERIGKLKAQEPRLITDTELEEIRKAPLILKPNVDAIPVGWMRDKMRGYASALKSTETAALVMVMQMWQKEQEAR